MNIENYYNSMIGLMEPHYQKYINQVRFPLFTNKPIKQFKINTSQNRLNTKVNILLNHHHSKDNQDR